MDWQVFYYIPLERVVVLVKWQVPGRKAGYGMERAPTSPGREFANSCIIITMIELNIPGRDLIQLHHLVCDVNGTLAVDGKLLDGLVRILGSLQDRLTLHLVTADVHGRQDVIDQQLGFKAVRVQRGDEAAQKAEYVRSLGADKVAAIGQGANDAGMLAEAALGICVLSPEGAAFEALSASDMLVSNIYEAFELFNKPMRIVATLRK